MTRLLAPEMFGLMAIANTVILGLNLCSYVGLQHNIIQSSRGDEKNYLDTAWTLQVIRGVILFVAALLIAGVLYLLQQTGFVGEGSVYADSSLPLIIAALSFWPLVSGFDSMKLATASRHMQVRKLTIIELSSQVVALLLMNGLALTYKSIWVLVVGSLAGGVVRLIMSYSFLQGESNRFRWESSAVHDLVHFGKWILFTTILGYFARNGDRLILGGLVSPTVLGIYNIAFFMAIAISDVLLKWVDVIILPKLSASYRENPQSLPAVYYKYSLPFNVVGLFACGLLFGSGYILIDILYDARYEDAGHMLQILALSMLGIRTKVAEQCFIAIGKPKLIVPVAGIQLLFLFFGLAPAYNNFGLDAALLVIAFTYTMAMPVTWYFLKKHHVLNWKQELLPLPALFVGYGFSKLLVIGYDAIKAAYF